MNSDYPDELSKDLKALEDAQRLSVSDVPDVPDTPDVPEEQNTPRFYWLASCALILGGEKALMPTPQLNVLLNTSDSFISKQMLGNIQQVAIDRGVRELLINPDEIVDVVVQSISMLGAMTSSQFGFSEETVQKAAEEVANQNDELNKAAS